LNELTYHREGDYLLPNVIPPENPHIGIWGMRRREFLRKHHSGIYTGLLFSGKLNAHLEEIDRSANEMYDLLMKQYAKHKGIAETLKVGMIDLPTEEELKALIAEMQNAPMQAKASA